MVKLLVIVLAAGIINWCYSNDKINDKVVNSANDVCPIKIGSAIPDVSVSNIQGDEENLKNIIGEKPSIIIFYRGGWCPYCNLHLAELVTIEDKLIDMGYKIIAISMDKPEKLKESLDKYEMKYSLYSDSKANAAKAFGIAFKITNDYNEKLKSHNMNIEEASGEEHQILPVPSVFIVNDGIIKFEYVNPDYKERISSDILFSAAEQIISKE